MPYFVFAEFGNEEVISFLVRLRKAISGDDLVSPIHITLRGPYAEPPSMPELQELAARLPGYGVRIAGYGYFSTPKGFAVFLRAESAVFRELWDKPDFRVPPARIEPHITMFESANRADAAMVRDFLRVENPFIHTYNLYLRVYESRARQSDLFGLPTAVPDSKPLARDLWRVPDGIFDRAEHLRGRLNAQQAQSDA